jgi:hypothetical protein
MTQNKPQDKDKLSRTMSSHNTKPGNIVRREDVVIEDAKDGIRVLRSTLLDTTELSVSEAYDGGGDPYNSTGRHVVIKAKLDLGD